MLLSVTTKAGKQAEITLTENNNRMSFVSLVTVDGKEIKGDWRLEGKLVKNYTNKIAIELKEENLSQISVENLKIAKASYSNRYLSIVSNDEGYFAVKEAMKNTCSSLSEVEQILDGKEMLVSELISKLESKLQDYDVIEETKTAVEFTAKNYDEEQDGNFERKEYKVTKKTLVKKEVEEVKQTIYHNENSGWYLINDNYKDVETIKEEEIDLTQYKIVKIESSECDIDYGFDEFNGVAKCYTWEGQDGIWYLEEEGCFTKFNSCEELESFMNAEY